MQADLFFAAEYATRCDTPATRYADGQFDTSPAGDNDERKYASEERRREAEYMRQRRAS